ncbi:MAG TPA: glycosyltransferase family 39 protein, partial [Planctomycetota bacterium]|nr:glycosyltransferase family 39 protein [Planctomycetota bacterium]
PKTRWLLTGVLALAFLICAWNWVRYFDAALASMPHGQWDAWAMWNPKARFLASDDWLAGFSPEIYWSHPDYPLLFPAAIAHGWAVLGEESAAVPRAMGALFTFGTVLLLSVSVAALRGVAHGLLAGIVMMGCAAFAGHGVTQYADVPLSFFYLATLVFIAHHDLAPERQRGWLVLAGLAAGMAASTKNEGLAFCVSAAVSLGLVTALFRGAREGIRSLIAFLLGAAPFLLVTLSIKLFLAPKNWLLRQQTELTLTQRLLSGERIRTIAHSFWSEFKAFGGFAGHIAGYLLALYALVLGVRLKAGHTAPLIAMLTLVATIGSVCFVLLATPFNLQWQLGTSSSRLFCQWLPSLIFVYFLWLDTPEERAAEPSPVSSAA